MVWPVQSPAQQNLDQICSWRKIVGARAGRLNYLAVKVFALSGGTKVSLAVFHPAHVSLRPALATGGSTITTSALADAEKASLAVNGGYFNLSNGESTSFVVMAGKICADPRLNKALTGNARLNPFLAQIYNRSELRFLKKTGSARGQAMMVKISPHNEALPAGMELIDSLQAGPRLLPDSGAEGEAFVRSEADGRQVDSIGVSRTAARTAVGLTADGHILIVAVAGHGQDEFSSGLTLADLAKLLKNLGAVDAMNMDGGTSTTMVQLNKVTGQYEMLIGRTPQTRVRSALVVCEL